MFREENWDWFVSKDISKKYEKKSMKQVREVAPKEKILIPKLLIFHLE